jgi:hypothetical protein
MGFGSARLSAGAIAPALELEILAGLEVLVPAYASCGNSARTTESTTTTTVNPIKYLFFVSFI